MIFEEKYFSCFILLTNQTHYLIVFNLWDIEQYVLCNSLLTRLWLHKFRNQPYLSNQTVFSVCSKFQDKDLNILRAKRSFKMKKNIFIIFEGLSLKQIKNFLEGESLTKKLRKHCLSINLTKKHGWMYLPQLHKVPSLKKAKTETN